VDGYKDRGNGCVPLRDDQLSYQLDWERAIARSLWGSPMNAADFRRIALSLAGAEEGSHMGAADFRVGGKIFATLASQDQGYGNLMLTPEQQAEFVAERPAVFMPIAGGGG